MNSRQRRKERRLVQRIARDYKVGRRGEYYVGIHPRERRRFLVIYSEDEVVARVEKDRTETYFLKWFPNFPSEIESLTFLEPLVRNPYKLYPAYKVKGGNYAIVPWEGGKGVQWIELDRFSAVPFEEVFESLSRKAQEEAIWILPALRGD